MKLVLMIVLFTSFAISQERYVIQADNSISEKRLEILGLQVGTQEVGNNRGAIIDMYNDSVSGYKKGRGNPYCQSLCSYAWMVAGGLPYPKTALANVPFNYAKKYGAKSIYKAVRGDEITYKYTNSSFGHKETIILVLQNGNVLTIAGNVSSKSITNDARNGGVKIMQRSLTKKLGLMYVRGLVGFNK